MERQAEGEKGLPTGNRLMNVPMNQLRLDPDSCAVSYKAEAAKLTQREMDLLSILVRNRSRVLSRDEIVNGCWREAGGNERRVDICVYRLRRKLNRIGHPGIRTVLGRGYILDHPN